MNLKNIINRIVAVAVLTVMVGFQSANAQATKTDKASVEKVKSTTEQILPGERHPEDIAIDKKMAAQGNQPTRTASSFEMPERHPEDVAIDKEMTAQGIQPTRTTSSSAIPERHPEDVAIDQKLAAQKGNTKQATPAQTESVDNEYATDEEAGAQAENTSILRHDGTEGAEPHSRGKQATISTVPDESNPDGSVRKAGDPVQKERVRAKTTKVQATQVEANEDGTVKGKKEEN